MDTETNGVDRKDVRIEAEDWRVSNSPQRLNERKTKRNNLGNPNEESANLLQAFLSKTNGRKQDD
jgi:hypothetical protein